MSIDWDSVDPPGGRVPRGSGQPARPTSRKLGQEISAGNYHKVHRAFNHRDFSSVGSC